MKLKYVFVTWCSFKINNLLIPKETREEKKRLKFIYLQNSFKNNTFNVHAQELSTGNATARLQVLNSTEFLFLVKSKFSY